MLSFRKMMLPLALVSLLGGMGHIQARNSMSMSCSSHIPHSFITLHQCALSVQKRQLPEKTTNQADLPKDMHAWQAYLREHYLSIHEGVIILALGLGIIIILIKNGIITSPKENEPPALVKHVEQNPIAALWQKVTHNPFPELWRKAGGRWQRLKNDFENQYKKFCQRCRAVRQNATGQNKTPILLYEQCSETLPAVQKKVNLDSLENAALFWSTLDC